MLVRAVLTSAVLAAGALLAGCNSDEISLANNAKANQPVPPRLVADMAARDMDMQSPMLVRLFKQEAELEVWKQDRSGRFALLKTYPICRWSGDLGPKTREGDRQAPEGFYSITPAQMNPQSSYYLSFNIGYPNAYDKALGHTGSQLMVHGDCSSRGCYAMTDEQIAEIYSLGRESFFGGQRAFQVQAYPFRMTPVNMARHRNNPNMPFWKMIKTGYDHFELTRQEPKVEFCENKYVFDPEQPANSSRPLVFNASAKCPAYVVSQEVADAVREKQRHDELEASRLAARGTPVARMNTGIDGGMNRIFASKIPDGDTGLSEGGSGQGLSLVALSPAPGTIPATVNPPHPSDTLLSGAPEEPVVAVAVARAPRVVQSAPTTRVASAVPPAQSESFLGSVARRIGLGGADTAPAASNAPIPAKPRVIEATRGDVPRPSAAIPKAKAGDSKVAARPALKPSLTAADQPAAAAPPTNTMSGATPVVPANSFESRFSAIK